MTLPEQQARQRIDAMLEEAGEDRLPGAVEVGGSWRSLRAKLMSGLEAGGGSAPAQAGTGDEAQRR